MPLNEVIYDFFDALKSRTRGYASLDYEFLKYQKAKLVKLDILLNKDLVDAFSTIVPESEAYARKDVIAKCYGGDISRKKKLLEKQKEGKKRMRQFGKVDVPQEAFTEVLKFDDDN